MLVVVAVVTIVSTVVGAWAAVPGGSCNYILPLLKIKKKNDILRIQ